MQILAVGFVLEIADQLRLFGGDADDGLADVADRVILPFYELELHVPDSVRGAGKPLPVALERVPPFFRRRAIVSLLTGCPRSQS